MCFGKIKQQDEGLEVKLGEQVTSLNPGLRRGACFEQRLEGERELGKSILEVETPSWKALQWENSK